MITDTAAKLEHEPPKQNNRLRLVLFRAAATVVGLVVALTLVEVALRLLSLAPTAAIATVTEAEFRRVPGLFSPGQSVVDRQLPALPFSVRIDSLGYRGADFALAKSPSELRILMVGDSFTYGDFVDDSVTLPQWLGRRLSKQCMRPVTVINAGVGGSTITTASAMVDRGWVTSPDVVILVFSENDIDDLRSDMWRELAENRAVKSRFPLSVAYPVLRRLAIWNFALKQRGRLRALGSAEAFVRPAHAAEPAPSDTLQRRQYGDLLARLDENVRSHGRRLILVAYPSHLTVKGVRSDELLRWLDSTATARGVTELNLLKPLRRTGLSVDSLYLLPHDGHPAPRGYQLSSEPIAQLVSQQGLCRA